MTNNEIIRDMIYDSGYKICEIAKKAGYSENHIKNVKNNRKGVNASDFLVQVVREAIKSLPERKVKRFWPTNKKIKKMINMRESGKTLQDIADYFGISSGSVHYFLRTRSNEVREG